MSPSEFQKRNEIRKKISKCQSYNFQSFKKNRQIKRKSALLRVDVNKFSRFFFLAFVMNYFAEGMVYLEQWDLKSKSHFFWYFEVHLMMAINRDEAYPLLNGLHVKSAIIMFPQFLLHPYGIRIFSHPSAFI